MKEAKAHCRQHPAFSFFVIRHQQLPASPLCCLCESHLPLAKNSCRIPAPNRDNRQSYTHNTIQSFAPTGAKLTPLNCKTRLVLQHTNSSRPYFYEVKQNHRTQNHRDLQ